jgi:tetratricopeptide (TPR) repeat protein
MNRNERRAAAGKNRNQPGVRKQETPAALYDAGRRHRLAGRRLEAQTCCEQALAIDPDHADTLHLMGLVSLDAGQYDHAIAWLSRAISQHPEPAYLASLGSALQRQGRLQDALKAYDKAVQLKPDDSSLWRDLGNLLFDLNRIDEALLSFQHVLTLDPGHWDAAYRCGYLLNQLGRPQEALGYLDIGHRLQPRKAVMLEMRAIALHSLKRYQEALAENQRAYALNAANPETCNNAGAALQFLGRDAEALPWFDRALKLRPNFIMAWMNRASSLQQMHRFEEAMAAYQRVTTMDPGNADAAWNLSLIDMLHGNFEAGWTGREARWNKADPGVYPTFSQPRWFGEDIAGKTILICADEGLGDTIQFARYVPMVAARGARVILVVDRPALTLLSGLPGIAECLLLSPDMTLPSFDQHCPMSGLPLAFATRLETIPAEIAYLPAPSADRTDAWEQRLRGREGSRRKLRVGLVWSGNPAHSNDHNRSVPLTLFSRILDLDATFVSLQKEPRPDDRQTLAAHAEVVDLTADLADFSDTAALVCCLDLVVSVDTSVAHLAAALGRSTWILLPYDPDYRWLLNRDDSPWYPTARLFRQTARREYAEVLEQVRTALQTLIAAR